MNENNGVDFNLDPEALGQTLDTSLTLAQASPTSPDDEAQLRAASKRLGIPLDTARSLPQETREADRAASFDSSDYAKRFPNTAKYLANPDNAMISGDDTDALATMEMSVDAFRAARLGPSVFGEVDQAGKVPTPEQAKQSVLKGLGFSAASKFSNELDRRAAQANTPQMKAWDGTINEFTYGDAARKALGNVTMTELFIVDQLAGSLGLDQTATRDLMTQTQQAIDGLGKDFATELATDTARAGGGGSILGTLGAIPGAVAGSGDALGVVGKFFTEQVIASGIGAGVGAVASIPLRKAAVKYIKDEMVARGVSASIAGAAANGTAVLVQGLGSNYQEGLSQGFTADEAASRAWTKTIAELPANMVAGALIGLRIGPNQITNVIGQSLAQGVGGGGGAAMASLSVGEEVDPLEVALEVIAEGVSAAPDIAIAGLTYPQALEMRAREQAQQQRIVEAQAEGQRLDELMAAAGSSLTRQRTPDTFAQLVQDAAEATEGAPTELFIDAQPLIEIMQNAGITSDQLNQMLPSVAEQLQEAAATEGSVAIPVGEATAAFAGTGFEQELVRYARTSEDGFSVVDAELAQQELSNMSAEAAALIAEQQDREAWEASAQAVSNRIEADLNTAGRFTSDVNRTYATLMRNYYAVTASKMGITPEALYEQFPLTTSANRVSSAGLLLGQGDRTTIYHGTTPEAAQAIESQGFDVSKSADGSIWFTSNPEIGEVAATGSGAVVKRAFNTSDLKLGGWAETDRYSTDELLAQGYDGLALEDSDGITYQIFNPEKLSQVTDELNQATLPTTIDIDGVQRSTVNSNGQPLAQTEEGVRNFWKWFGDSKVVDAEGKPLVVYHGSPQGGFDEFGDGANNTTSFFTSRFDVAASYAGRYEDVEMAEAGAEFYDENQGVYSVYLRIENPKKGDWDGADWGNGPVGLRTDDFANRAKLEGLDGAIMENVVDTGWLAPGLVEDEGDGTIYAVFDPKQIKSATGNSGAFDPADSNILRQSGTDPQDLYVGHNLSESNLRAALELGGLAAPSLGISRTSTGGFGGYGEITLLADKSILDSNGARTFNADVYSPRQPRPVYKVNLKKLYEFADKVKAMPMAQDRAARHLDETEVERYGAASLARVDGVQMLYLYEIGQLPKPKAKKVNPVIKKAAKLPNANQSYNLRDNPDFALLAKEHYEEQLALVAEADPDRVDRYRDVFFEEDGSVNRDARDRLAREVQAHVESGGMDFREYQAAIAKKLRTKAQSDAFAQWLEKQAGEFITGKQLKLSPSRKIPYTLDNVVAQMTKELRGGEGFNYGAGNIRAMNAAEITSIREVQNRRDEIVSAEDFEKVKDESDKRLEETLDALKPFYKFDADGWGYMNDATTAMAEGPKGWREAFRVNKESEKIIRDYLSYVKNLPTEYFETKMQRAVGIGEFKAAVVPRDTSKDIIEALEAAGLQIRKYDSKKDTGRIDAIAKSKDLLFQQQGTTRGTFNPETLNITLLEKADLSTFLHEAGHFFFEMQASIAARADAPAEIKADVDTLLRAVGFEGTAAEWLALPVDDRRIAHETVAESFEQYLFTGKAPSVELQTLFTKLRAWMKSVYQTLTQMLATNKNSALTPEVSAVFDRMLASDEAIEAAKQSRNNNPLYTSAESAGMTPEQFDDYLKSIGEMDDEAVRQLDARALRDMKWMRSARSKIIKELQKDATAKRRNARMEARRTLLQEPVYKALQFLRGKVEKAPIEKRSGKTLDTRRDTMIQAIAKLGGLNKESAVSQFGIDPADFPSKIVGFPTLRAGKSGKSVENMAENLAELGYLLPKGGFAYSLADFEQLLTDSGRGIDHFSIDADYDLIHGYKTLPAPDTAEELIFTAGRLSLPELEERYGNDPDFAWQELGIGRRGMIAEMGMPSDVIAELTGFNTGEEMIRALLDAEPLQDATEGLTDRIMMERWGDLSSEEDISRAADEALANEARARMVATELAALNKAVGGVRVVQNTARKTAEDVVGRQKLRNVRPDKSAGSAARAGKGAEKASAKGDTQAAAGFKRSQVLNLAIEREQRKVRTEVEKARDAFRGLFGNDKSMSKKRDMNMVNAARALLSNYNLAPPVGGQTALQYLSVLARENPTMADQIEVLTSGLPDGKDYRELTVTEFRDIRDRILGLFELSRRVMQVRIDGKLVDMDEAATPLVEAAISRNGGEMPGLLGYDNTITDKERMKVALLGFKAAGTRVEQWADAMSADVKRILFSQVSDAAVQSRIKRNALIKRYKELLDTVAPSLTSEEIFAPELGPKGFKFTRGKVELLHAILHTGNASNKRKLLLGRSWATLDAEGNVDTSKWDAFVNRMIDEGVITKVDYDFAQGVWDLMEETKRESQKAHFDIYGFYFNEVTADPIETPFGTYAGGYVPAMVTALSAADQAQKREAEAAQQGGNSYMFPTTGKGFTNARVEYNRPLELDLRTIGSHLDKVARFIHLEPVINDTGRLLMNKRVARAFNGLDTNIISKMLTPWLQRAAQQTTTVPTRFPMMDKIFRGIRTRAGMYIMFANIINTAQQITGFSVAALKVPAPKLLRATRAMMGNPKEMTAMVAASSPFMADRLENQGYELTQQIEQILTNPNMMDKGGAFMKRNAYFMQTGVQNVMDVAVWSAAYEHARETMGVTEKQAVRYADETIRSTQGTFAPEDISGIEVQPAFIQLFTQFWGYFNMLANTLGGEAGKAVREMGYMASTPRLMFIWFAGLMIPAVVGQILAQGLPDDEDDEDGDGLLDEYLAMFFGSQAATLAAMTPIVGQVTTLLYNQFDNKVYNDRLNLSPGIGMIESSAKGIAWAVSGTGNILQGEAFDDRLSKTEVRNVLIAIGMATGAPTNLIARPVGFEMDVEEGRKDPENTAEYVKGLATGR